MWQNGQPGLKMRKNGREGIKVFWVLRKQNKHVLCLLIVHECKLSEASFDILCHCKIKEPCLSRVISTNFFLRCNFFIVTGILWKETDIYQNFHKIVTTFEQFHWNTAAVKLIIKCSTNIADKMNPIIWWFGVIILLWDYTTLLFNLSFSHCLLRSM